MADKVHIWPDKDPHEVLDYDHDHNPKLLGDVIVEAIAEVVYGDVEIESTDHLAGEQKTWLRGGTDGTRCGIRLLIKTQNGREIEEAVRIRIKEKNKVPA